MDHNRSSRGRFSSVGKEEKQLIGNLLTESPGVRPMVHNEVLSISDIKGAEDDSRIPLALSELEEITRSRTAPLSAMRDITDHARPRSAVGAVWGSSPDICAAAAAAQPASSSIPQDQVQRLQTQSEAILTTNASTEAMRLLIIEQQNMIQSMMQQNPQQHHQLQHLQEQQQLHLHQHHHHQQQQLQQQRHQQQDLPQHHQHQHPQHQHRQQHQQPPHHHHQQQQHHQHHQGDSAVGKQATHSGRLLDSPGQPSPQYFNPSIPRPMREDSPPGAIAPLAVQHGGRGYDNEPAPGERRPGQGLGINFGAAGGSAMRRPPLQQPPRQAAAPPPAAVQPPLQQQQQEAQDNSQRIGVGPSLLTNPSPAHLMQHPPHPHAHIPVRPVARQVPHVQQPGMSAQAGIQQGIQPVAANKFVPQPRSVDVANPSQYQELDAAPTPPQGVLPPPTPPQQPQHRLQPAPPHHMQNPQHPFSNGQPPQQQHRFHPPPHAHQQQQQDDHHSRGHAAPSQLLEEFKRSDGSARNWDCATIRGHVPEFATDQEGSRMIQRRLEHNAATDLDIVYYELLDTALPLMTDVFGNYVIQKILEHGTELHQEGIVTAMEGHVVRLTLQTYGCRVVQKSLETCPLRLKLQMIRELGGSVPHCVQDQNGNHVIQKCIESMPENVDFIINAFRGQIQTLATHSYGCRVIQKILEFCKRHPHSLLTQQCRPVMDEIVDLIDRLISDQYGNYVLQHVMSADPEYSRRIVELLRHNFFALSTEKFASNVVEKMFECATPADRSVIVNALINNKLPDGQSQLLTLMKDRYANYVAQKIIDFASPPDQTRIVAHIRPHQASFRKLPYGKHILSRIDRLDGGRRVGPKGGRVS